MYALDPEECHWEGDCIMGAGNRSAIGTLVERRTRYLILVHVPNGRPTADAMREGITTALGVLPAWLRRTLTWDQGKELALHQQITEQTQRLLTRRMTCRDDVALAVTGNGPDGFS
ncbi:IS30 family transposase [Actinopolymorpha pittospori]|uniref:IS30 family transposase n=1 Tax=Actinopolymorpha pittospori TaxID=648752 RepID=A0A927MQX2_9ACTN|nr:IS30 family transposase [Actinopolymorpha pittospori]MBE1603593.1 IS30 family transposase [Actinopolymorpha pittospori]